MELERRHQVDASEETKPRESEEVEHDHAHEHVAYSDTGTIPPVEGEHVRPPQPSASERAFGKPPRGGAAEAGLTQPVTRVVHGITIVAPAGTHASAVDKAAELVELEIGRNEYAQQHMAAARTTIVIIPARTRMTDVPQFAALRGTQTFDGRDWSGVRGSGGMRAADGSFAIGVAEEDLISVRGMPSKHTTGYSIGMHELAHALESKGMTPDQKEQLEKLYKQQQKQDRKDPTTHHDAFTDDYASENKHEYFAQATNAFFGKNAGAHRPESGVGRPIKNHNGRDWLRAKDPDMYQFLVDMYETDRGADGKRAS